MCHGHLSQFVDYMVSKISQCVTDVAFHATRGVQGSFAQWHGHLAPNFIIKKETKLYFGLLKITLKLKCTFRHCYC